MAVEVRDPVWFGRVVRQAVAVRGFATQADFASACSVSLNTVVNVLTGSRAAYQVATFDHLAAGLAVPAPALVRFAGSSRPRDIAVAAQRLLDAPSPGPGQVSFVVTADGPGVDASVLEAALRAAVAAFAQTTGTQVAVRAAD